MRRARRAGGLLALAGLTAANACYAYLPVEGGATPASDSADMKRADEGTAARGSPQVPIAAGDQLRIELTAEGSRELARYLGPGVRVAEGSVASLDSSGTVTLAVEFVQLNNGVKMPWTGEGVVSFPAALRESVSRHTFRRRQTIMAGVALTAALVMTAVLALRQGGAGGDGGGGTPPPPP